MEDVQRAELIDPKNEIRGRVLGRVGGRVGASRSGKGAGHVVPTLIAWPESTFVYDPKGELWSR